jgi:carboxymethylenebutenolidase
MKQQFADIATPSGTMQTFAVHPEQNGPFPAVILYMDIWGVREELFDIARWLATVGYYCLVPDLFYRQGTIRHENRDAQGKMVSLSRLDEAARAKVLAPAKKHTDAEAMEDTQAILQFLAGDTAARTGAKGCFGYCLGGRLSLLAAARFAGEIKAAASMHGTALVTGGADSPHRLAEKIKGEFYCGFGANDHYSPPATIEQVAAAMKSAKVKYSYTVHAATDHGYALPDRDIYNKAATMRDWEQIMAMFHRQLPPYRS